MPVLHGILTLLSSDVVAERITACRLRRSLSSPACRDRVAIGKGPKRSHTLSYRVILYSGIYILYIVAVFSCVARSAGSARGDRLTRRLIRKKGTNEL